MNFEDLGMSLIAQFFQNRANRAEFLEEDFTKPFQVQGPKNHICEGFATQLARLTINQRSFTEVPSGGDFETHKVIKFWENETNFSLLKEEHLVRVFSSKIDVVPLKKCYPN